MTEVSSQEGSWVDPVSRRIFRYRSWRPAHVRHLVVLVHGFGEHGGRYQPFAQALAAQGLYVAVPDLWGHGRSGGRRGDLGQVENCVRQVWSMTQEVFLPTSGQTRYALFGHSFGGLAAIVWALHHPGNLRCLIVQSPLIEVGFPLPCWKTASATLLAHVWPAFSFSLRLDVGALSRDPVVVQAYRTDPLVHGSMSVRTYYSVSRTRDEVCARAHTLQLPVLLLCGTADRIISVPQAQRWFDRLTCEKRSVIFPDAYHELHHETVRAEAARLVLEWIETHA